MIPKNISADHVLKAIDRIRAQGYPEARASTRFDLIFQDERFPPKVVISYANLFANGQELPETEFSGGDESNDFLTALGFQIVPKDSLPARQAWIFQANP